MDGPLDNFGKIFKGIRIIFHRYNRQCCRTSHAHRKRVLFFPAFVSKNIKAIPYKKKIKNKQQQPPIYKQTDQFSVLIKYVVCAEQLYKCSSTTNGSVVQWSGILLICVPRI